VGVASDILALDDHHINKSDRSWFLINYSECLTNIAQVGSLGLLLQNWPYSWSQIGTKLQNSGMSGKYYKSDDKASCKIGWGGGRCQVCDHKVISTKDVVWKYQIRDAY
jgi:hypothetical protein